MNHAAHSYVYCINIEQQGHSISLKKEVRTTSQGEAWVEEVKRRYGL